MDRPPLPKKLASRIVAAQNKVTSTRDGIIHYDQRIKQSQAELDEFDAAPDAYASNRYGRNGVDSYPVQTRISRQREELDYRTRNLPRKHDELAAAEQHLAEVEAEVLRELAAMRPNTPGRVPWPAPLPTFKRHREEMNAARERLLKSLAEQRAREQAEYEARQREEDARLAEESEREWQAWRDSMTPEERDQVQAWFKEFKAGLDAGRFTFADFLEHLRNRRQGPASST